MVSVEYLDSGIALISLNMPGSSANVLTTEMFEELDRTFAELSRQTDLSGIILISSKPRIFVAGADLKAINNTLDWPAEKIVSFCETGRSVMRRLSTMPFPTCAAIHGACVGGGLELALWCDFRIAADQGTTLGLPEVKLGLVPGWGGTVRLPRMASLQVGLDLVTSGRLVTAQQAYEMGWVDNVVAQDARVRAAETQLQLAVESGTYLQKRQQLLGPVEQVADLKSLRSQFIQEIANRAEIHDSAPRLVLEHMLETATLNHDQALASESIVMSKAYGSPPSRGLLNHFFLAEHNRKEPGFVDTNLVPEEVSQVGIVGAGIMGCSIAHVCVQSGMGVVLLDNQEEALTKARDYLDSDQVTTTNHYKGLSGCDLVIEAVVESLPIKQQVFHQIQQVICDETIIATNTSAIPLRRMVDSIVNPTRFCGIHFCHPQILSLIEVIRGDVTSEQTIATAVGFVRAMRKMPVAVKDAPGFVVNRLLTIMLDQSLRLAEQGHTIHEIDQAMQDFGFRGGPFEIMDVIGIDTCMLAGRAMWDSGIRSLTPSPVLPKMVKKGWLGRKSLNGFYRYDKLDGERKPNPEADQLLIDYQIGEERIANSRIAHSVMSAMVLEATHILEHQIVADPRDIDLCIINGLSFPSHLGGLLFWADQFGIGEVNSFLDQLAIGSPQRAPNAMLRTMAFENTPFYS